MNESFDQKKSIRDKVIGLGEDSKRKSYYPQLQDRVDELLEQKMLLEQKNDQLSKAMDALNQTQDLLLSNEYKYRTLFENANDAIFIINSQNFKFEDCNNKALALVESASKEELFQSDLVDFFPAIQPSGKNSNHIAEELLEQALSGNQDSFEWELKKKDGTKVICMISLNSIELLGNKLIQAIVRDITRSKKFEQELGLATIRSEEKERMRFAKELHDGIGPILSTIKLYIQCLEDDNTNENNNLILNKANQGIIEATNSLKEISYNLSPHVLKNYGLLEAVNQFTERIKLTKTIRIDCQYDIKKQLNEDLEMLCYRVITELINNTLKYAQAKSIVISLKNEGESLAITYADNGIGVDLEHKRLNYQSMGLFNIENRVQNFGGTVKIISKPGHGFKVDIFINDLKDFNASE